MAPSVHVIPHTHWDREWYEPFPTFWMALVDLLDDLLPRLDGDDPLRHFQLDGQMAVIDDYLEIRPEAEPLLSRLNTSGRLSMGPWYVLPDEFLVSGETLVRNLQLGRRRARRLGGAMEVGYLPDMFGHISAMPQILTLFGLDHAVLWRGVPASVNSPAFIWQSPDGSSVRAEYLSGGYGNGFDMPVDATELAGRINEFMTNQGPLVGGTVLWMAGMDHARPPEHLGAVVADLDSLAGWSATVGSLDEYLESAPSTGLTVHRGELRSGARANLLMGVASNHVDVKIAAAIAERSLERHAEPLAALWSEDPARLRPFMERAWLEVIRNSAHDSICACSHDEVVRAVRHRYDVATRLAVGVADRSLQDAARSMREPGTYVLNPSSVGRDEVIEIDSTDPSDTWASDPTIAQVVGERSAEEVLHVVGAAEAPQVVAREIVFEHPDTLSVDLDYNRDRSEVIVRLMTAPPSATSSGPESALDQLGEICTEDPRVTVQTILVHKHARRRTLVMSGPVAGYGWTRWRPRVVPVPVTGDGRGALSNGLVDVSAAADGTFTINGIPGYGRLVDEGDAGDTYNWCPVDDPLDVDEPESVRVIVDEEGPLRGRLSIECRFVVPASVQRDGNGRSSRTGSVLQVVSTVVELRAGEPFVRVHTSMENRANDHRLRVHLPLRSRTDHSLAECAFAMVTRALDAEGGPNEWGVPTFPSRRFVSAGDMTVTHQGLCEYELIDLDGPVADADTTAGTLALTLLRSVGVISRPPMPSRPLPAGPSTEVPDAQLRTRLDFEYAIAPGMGNGIGLDPFDLADRVWSPLPTVNAPGGGHRGDEGQILRVEGAVVDALFRDEEGALMLRVHEPHSRVGELVVDRSGEVVDLGGRTLGAFGGVMELRPNQIVTIRLR